MKINLSQTKLIAYALIILTICLSVSYCAYTRHKWPMWEQFKQYYISSDGRVIDPFSPQQITTSEGQAYALFFALVAHDKNAFDIILEWTENYLAAGDLTSNLPAWLWGKNADGEWAVLDNNSASDADLWIAYDLLEAGRIWSDSGYHELGVQLLERIATEEVANIPGLGEMVIPGKRGFVQDKMWRLNPSYTPQQLLTLFSKVDKFWNKVSETNKQFLIQSSPKGFAPDWIIWNETKGFAPGGDNPNEGSYNAIRVYLWAGMLDKSVPTNAELINHFQPIVHLVEKNKKVPLKINSATGSYSGTGPSGFYQALLPLMANKEDTTTITKDAYYNSVLTLFGQGYVQGLYRFGKEGELILGRT